MTGGTNTISVLHIDDEPDFADLAATFLERQHDKFDVKTAASPSEGLDVLAGKRIDCVVSDYDMPGMDGIEFLRVVRDEYPDLPFILYTGKGSEEIASEAISAGVTDYLQKQTGSDHYRLLANRIQNAVARVEYRQRIKELHHVAVEFESLEKVEAVCEHTVEAALDLLAFEDAGVSLYNDEDDQFETIAAENVQFGLPHSVSVDDSLAGRTFREQATITIEDTDDAGIIIEDYSRQSVLSTPIDGHGVLQVGIDTVGAISEEEIELAELLANHAAEAITRIEREKELKRQRDRFNRLFNSLPEPAVLLPEEERATIGDVNPAFEDVFGYDAETIRGCDLNELIVPSDRQERASRIDERGYDGEVFREEVIRETADGQPRDFLLIGVGKQPDTEGAQSDGFAIYTDITEQKERERQLEYERNRFGALFETLPEPAALVSGRERVDSTIDRVNPAFEEVFGYERKEVIGEHLNDLIVPDDRTKEAQQIDQSNVDGDLPPTEVRRQTADGEMRDFLLLATGLEELGSNDIAEGFVIYADITERKDKQRQLEQLRTELEIALETTNAGMWTWDLSTDEVKRHPTLERLLGLAPGELGKDPEPFAQRIHPDYRSQYLDEYQTIAQDGGEFNIECRIKHDNGTWRWIREQGQVITDGAGEPIRVIGTTTDITAAKEREEKLTALNDVTRELLNAETVENATEQAVAAAKEILDMELSIIHQFDPEQNQLNPRSATEEFSRLVKDPKPVHPGDAIVWRAFDNGEIEFHADVREDPAVMDEKTSFRGQIVFPLDEYGTLTCASPTIGGLTDEDRKVGRILAAAVTTAFDRINYEEELSRQRDRFELLFETLPEPTTLVKGNDTPDIVDVNPAFEETFGYDADAIQGENLNELIVPPDQHEKADRIDRKAASEDHFTEEVQRETADGEQRDFLLIASDRRAVANMDFFEGFVIYVDITDRKKFERRLQRQNERLDRFASIISHDLRNPLNVAEGHLELVRDECDSEYLDPIERAHDRMGTLIEDILTLARQGETVSDFDQINLGDLVEECGQNVETLDATIRNQTDRTIRGDETRVRQILENLIRNAVEHVNDDVTITIDDLPDGFYIEDDGDGVPKEDRDAVFKRGYTTADNGTGFGLTIVKEIVTAHDWNIRITEGSNGGARFEITDVDIPTNP